jgi:cell division protein FtsN
MAVARTLVIDREQMADEPMHRPVRGHGQPHPQPAVDNPRARRGEDPLAELARLIGQEDPFAEFSGSSAQRRPSVNGTNSRYSRPVAVQPDRRADRPSNGAYAREREADHAPVRQADPRHQTQRPTQQPARGYEQRAPQREQDRYQPRTRSPQARDAHDYDQYEQPAARPRTSGRADTGYARSRDPYADEAPRQSRSAYAEDPRTARRADRYEPEEALRPARGRQQAYQEPYNRGYEDDYDPDYADDAYLPEHADDIYGEVPRPRRSWGLYLVVGIVALCLVAVAFLGVFAYRTVFNTPPRPAQVTKSNAPTKVDPKSTPQNAAAPNKTIQDRIGATGPEQVIPREEQPTDLTQQPNQQRVLQFDQPPQQQAPQPVQRPQQKGPAFTPPPTQQQAPQQVTNPDQPKKVKTLTVRSDGTVVPNTAPQQQAPQGPLPLNANPNSLEPETNVAPPTPRPNSNLQNNPPRQQQAAVAPSIAPSTGNYVVQVASHKTQEEAQAAWNNIRNQHAAIFGNRNADIRRVDLGDRGTFYRAMVGPMGRDQANALCQNLKTAGAGCIVQTR